MNKNKTTKHVYQHLLDILRSAEDYTKDNEMSLENAILEIIKEELYKIYYESDEELRTKYYKFSKQDNIDIDSFAEKLCKMQSLFSVS